MQLVKLLAAGLALLLWSWTTEVRSNPCLSTCVMPVDATCACMCSSCPAPQCVTPDPFECGGSGACCKLAPAITDSPAEYESLDPVTGKPSSSPATTRPSLSPTTARPSTSPTSSKPSRAPATSRPSGSPSTKPSRSPTNLPSSAPLEGDIQDILVTRGAAYLRTERIVHTQFGDATCPATITLDPDFFTSTSVTEYFDVKNSLALISNKTYRVHPECHNMTSFYSATGVFTSNVSWADIREVNVNYPSSITFFAPACRGISFSVVPRESTPRNGSFAWNYTGNYPMQYCKDLRSTLTSSRAGMLFVKTSETLFQERAKIFIFLPSDSPTSFQVTYKNGGVLNNATFKAIFGVFVMTMLLLVFESQ